MNPRDHARPDRWRGVVGAMLLGTLWGVTARAWMRYISDDPSFTWGGTAFILIGPTLIGLAMGVVRTSRRPAWSRVAGGASPLLIGIGAGIVMVPTVLLGGIALGRTPWRWWVRALVGVLALVPVGAVLLLPELGHIGVVKRLAASLWYVLLCWWLAAMVAVSYRPYPPRAAEPVPVR